MVVVAEGVGSRTRDLVFPGENEPRWMDLTIAYFTIPRVADDDRRWRWYNATKGRSVSLRPDAHGTTRASLTIQQPPGGEQDWDADRQKAYMREQFADAGWQAARVLAGMEAADDFYFDVLRQVRMKRWSKCRVVLTGDAARALAAYEAAMRPMVGEGQGVPKIGLRIMNPHSRIGIRLLHGALKVASRPPIRDLAAKIFTKVPKSLDLSRYPIDQHETAGVRSP